MRSRISAAACVTPARPPVTALGHPRVDLVEHADRGAQLPGRAIAALERVVLDERPLQRVQLAVLGESLDRDHLCAVVRDGERQAGVDAAAIEQHGAGAALAVVAALLGAGEPELLAQHVEQGTARIHGERQRLAVDQQLNLGPHDRLGSLVFALHAQPYPRRARVNAALHEVMIRRRDDGACARMTDIQSEIPAPPGPEPSPSPPPIEDPPIGDPPPEGPEVPVGDPSRMPDRDLGGPEDTIAGPGDGTEGPEAPDEPGPRPPGFPDPPGTDEDASDEPS